MIWIVGSLFLSIGYAFFNALKDRKKNDIIVFIVAFFLAVSGFIDRYKSMKQGDRTEASSKNAEALGKIDTSITKHIAQLDSINNKLENVNNKLATNINKNVNANLEVSHSIKSIDSEIETISNDIKYFNTGGDTYPFITFGMVNSTFGDFFINTKGTYPLHFLYIVVIDLDNYLARASINYQLFDTAYRKTYSIPFVSGMQYVGKLMFSYIPNSPQTRKFAFWMITAKGKYLQLCAFKYKYTNADIIRSSQLSNPERTKFYPPFDYTNYSDFVKPNEKFDSLFPYNFPD